MAIAVDNLQKTYKEKRDVEVRALKGISFNLSDTGMVFVLGKSGCGKSTLLNMLGGLDGFDGGDIVIDGQSIKDYKAKDLDSYRNDYIGFVFQENNLLEKESVKRNISLALDLQSNKDTEGKVGGILERVGLKDLSEQKCNCISGGQKQRVAIARALIKSPKLLLCDEPTGALDSETGEEIFTLLKELSQDRLVVVVSHDRESAEKYGDRVIELKDGEIISDTAPLEVQPLKEPAKEVKHGGLRFARAFTLGAGYIIAKPIRMAICLLLCLITFACVGVVDVFISHDRDEVTFKAMEEFGSKCYTFGKAYKNYEFGYDLNDFGMSESEAEELCSLLDVDRCDYMYNFSGWQDNVGMEANDPRLSITYATGYVETDEKFLNDYGFTLVEGRLPENTGEVAISEFEFRFFKSYGYMDDDKKITQINSYVDLIGMEIVYKNYPLTLTVTGIVDTYFKYNEKTDFLFNGTPYGSEEYTEGWSGIGKILLDDVQGMLFVCKDFKDYFYEKFSNSLIEEYAVKKLIAPYNGSDARKLKNIRVYTTQYDGEPVDEKYGDCYHLINYGAYLSNEPEQVFIRVNPYLPYVLAVLIAINVLFLAYYASGTVEEKRKEVGILRALGASRGDIVKITACEHGVFTLGAVALSSAVGAIVAAVLNKALLVECVQFLADFAFLRFGIRQFALVLAVALASVAAGIAFPLIKLLTKKPVDVIADRK